MLRVSPLGARIVSLTVAVAGTGAGAVAGERREVTCGVGDAAYLASEHFLGASVGRYANRIARGDLSLAGDRHRLATQPGGHTLHGGPDGFDKRVWAIAETSERHAVLSLDSPDGDQGFPGRLRATVRYVVTDDGLDVSYAATTDAPTIVCLTNHTYFALGGEPGSGLGRDDVRRHRLQVSADRYTPVDAEQIPTGEVAPVAGTPFDLRRPMLLADVVGADHPQITGGLDHNLVLDDHPGPQIRLVSPEGDLTLEMTTDQPAVQVYAGHGLDQGRGAVYPAFAGIALETQVSPDTPHHPAWPSAVLRPGEEYRHHTSWRFLSH